MSTITSAREAISHLRHNQSQTHLRLAADFAGEVCDMIAARGWARVTNTGLADGPVSIIGAIVEIAGRQRPQDGDSDGSSHTESSKWLFVESLLTFDDCQADDRSQESDRDAALARWNCYPERTQRQVLSRCRAAQRRLRAAALATRLGEPL